MGKRGQGRPVHGRTGGRGNGRAGKRGRKQLSGMPDGGLSMIDCLIDTLPGDRPRSRRGRGNGGGGGGGGRDGRPRNTGNGARTSGGRPRDTTKRQGWVPADIEPHATCLQLAAVLCLLLEHG